VITVRYFAGAKAAAGTDSEQVALDDGGTVIDVLTVLSHRHGEQLRRVLSASTLLLDEVAVRDRTHPLPPTATLDVLPPFAGG
jgi:molybdopterin synthase sulfur carrier subunit